MVTALLVSHGGARWLPAVLEGLATQSRPVDRAVAVDTGSKDESPALLRAALGEDRVRTAPRSTSWSAAVDLGLEALPASEDEWVWLLHDDANPAPDALEQLLAASAEDPDADVLGPKLREWPSLRRLLELGVTISGTGHRETGLERGEYDQGQHDEVREVLAVNTAGMLVRRSVLERLGGFDDDLAVFGNDIDFGWRAARAGHRTIVVPQAVVFHAEAAHRGTRRTPLTGRHTHYQERRAALWTLLVNRPRRGLAWQVLRLAVGSVLRALGLLVLRAPGQALDELASLGWVYSRPGRILAARRDRAALDVGADESRQEHVRSLLPPWWLPYRHGLDAVGDLVQALSSTAQDVAERRRAAAYAADAGLPLPTEGERGRGGRVGSLGEEDEEDLAPDNGWVARMVTSPVALAMSVFLLLVLVATRVAWGPVEGGGLDPAPASSGDWWRLYVDAWHPLAQGTAVPAPAYVPVLAAIGSLLGGSASAAVSVVLLLSLPLAAWGAWRLLRVAGHLADPLGAPRWLLAWGSVAYAMVPATSGAWSDGRIGAVAVAAVLPWLGHAALGFADPEPDRRRRAGWRTGLLLSLATAFAPAAWPFALVLTTALLGAGAAIGGRAVLGRSVAGPPLVALGVPVVLLLPWWWPLLRESAASGLLLDPGRLPTVAVSGLDLLTGQVGEHGAWFLPGLVLVVLGVLALIPSATRVQVLVCWVVAVVAVLTALLLALLDLPLGVGATTAGLAFFVVLVQGLAVVAAVVAGTGPARRLVRGTMHRVVGAVTAIALFAVPFAGLLWFTTASDDVLAAPDSDGIPAYMEQDAALGPAHGILVLEGGLDSGVEYTVRRGDGPTVGESEVQALTPPDQEMTALVSDLLTQPRPGMVTGLADRGIEYVLLRAPADPAVAGTLDTAPGLAQASAEDRSTRAWQVERELSPEALAPPGGDRRAWLLGVQAVALVLVLVLCLPTGLAGRRETS
jgi:GT2 family glycosyltransferase